MARGGALDIQKGGGAKPPYKRRRLRHKAGGGEPPVYKKGHLRQRRGEGATTTQEGEPRTHKVGVGAPKSYMKGSTRKNNEGLYHHTRRGALE